MFSAIHRLFVPRPAPAPIAPTTAESALSPPLPDPSAFEFLTYAALLSMLHTRMQDLMHLHSSSTPTPECTELQNKLQRSLLAAQYPSKFYPYLQDLYTQCFNLLDTYLPADTNRRTSPPSTITSQQHASTYIRLLIDIHRLSLRASKLDLPGLLSTCDSDTKTPIIPAHLFPHPPSPTSSTTSWTHHDDTPSTFLPHARPTTPIRQLLFSKFHPIYRLTLHLLSFFPPAPPRRPIRTNVAKNSCFGFPGHYGTESSNFTTIEFYQPEQVAHWALHNEIQQKKFVKFVPPRVKAGLEQIAEAAEVLRCRVMVLAYRAKNRGYIVVPPEVKRG
ncbi:hypothetical protein BJ508DRAFT_341665 [Ascobolus immersus RN42]|uniref:Uncharacterized protein n=1 Tax=Ascobolus immersus RN42 TaxID=1160509 RepID=A0A3N4HMA1_ASCIM|nr:hypothetical protein BJ508DRAFT_341665 [Ascobolus immersus RN42]